MTPIRAIVISITLGSVAVGRDDTPFTIIEAYGDLKELIAALYPKFPSELLEAGRRSRKSRAALENRLGLFGAGGNEKLISAAHRLNALVIRQAPQTVAAVPIEFSVAVTANLCLSRLIGTIKAARFQVQPEQRQQPQQQYPLQQSPFQQPQQQQVQYPQRQQPQQQYPQQQSHFQQQQQQRKQPQQQYPQQQSHFQQQQQQQQQQRQQPQQQYFQQQQPQQSSQHEQQRSSAAEIDSLETERTRTIDVNLLADDFTPGKVATLTVTLRLPANVSRGKWQGYVTLDQPGPVSVTLEARGFTILSEPHPPLVLPPDRDTAPLAFELRIEEAGDRWIHVFLSQEGRVVGELTINDFSGIGNAPNQQGASARWRRIAEADLMLVVRTDEGRIEACSPRERASLDHVTMTGFRYPATPFRQLLADRLRSLYDDRSDAEETARELQIVGVELTACLPVDLVALLRRTDIRTVMLRHEDDFDFPLELCYIDSKNDPFFVGDRIAVCRWYLGVMNPPDIVSKQIRRVAFLKGNDKASDGDEVLLNRLYPGFTTTLTKRSEVIEQLFKTSHFDLIHFTGHCRQMEKTLGGLEMADGTSVRLLEIGQLEAERAFAAAQPFVVLNACASAQPYLGLTQKDSFAHRFVTSRACALLGTLWPVSGPVATEFAERFYAELGRLPIGQALLAAKLALVQANADEHQEGVSPIRRLARQVAVRSYCLFANPDFRLVQK
jgi:hypothetical protein